MKRKIDLDKIVKDYIKKHSIRFISVNLEDENSFSYLATKIMVIHEISKGPVPLPLGLTEEVYMSKCHKEPVLDVKGVLYCLECGYETKAKTEVRESVYGMHVRASTPKNPLDLLRPFTI